MKTSFDLAVEISEQYDFNSECLDKIGLNPWVKNQWPLVYFIQNDVKKIAYVGESTNALTRIKSHLSNPKRSQLNKISIIGSDKFNKSAALDLESSLIQYINAEGTYELQNGNYGLINHSYYQQDLYRGIFKAVWSKLLEKKIVTKSLSEIENSEFFKYSPFKSLNKNQYESVLSILEGLTTKKSNTIFISGSAGTGKTILATYLMKLLTTPVADAEYEDLNDDEIKEINYIKEFQKRYPNAKIGLVIAMNSLKETIENVFRRTPGLKASMVINPSDTFKVKDKYDLLIIDEAHRLRQYKNISWMGAFKQNNKKLGLDDNGNELDWIIANSKNQIFFYDPSQSVKPSDVDPEHFAKLITDKRTLKLELSSQMRVKGGNDYISFVNDLLHVKRHKDEKYSATDYELFIFDSLADLYSELTIREDKFKLCRLIAGYSWPWASDPRKNPKPDPNVVDIEIDGLRFKWNSEPTDWINSPNAFNEIGCIHTTQGYDLNYAGIIFGNEIRYNPEKNQIEVDKSQYFDINGKKGISDPEDLKSYIINIYKTSMYRGIKGTFIYACDKYLREYLKRHVFNYVKEPTLRILKHDKAKPFVNSVPLLDLNVAAGSFSVSQISSKVEWIELPFNIAAKKDYFVCKVTGESMNQIIPNGSYCLFEKDHGGSRNGKIVLVQHSKIQDSEFGYGYTVKKYQSEKTRNSESWSHSKIVLSPLSNIEYKDIVLGPDELNELKVIGIFIQVIN
jgi:uncharacterized protein